MKHSLLDIIQETGLTEKAAKVYLAGLELGETTIQRLAQKTKLQRTTVYRLMTELKHQGLFSTSISQKKRLFTAEDPQKLLEHIDAKKNKIEKALPELTSLMALFDKKPHIKYYEGEAGIKEIYADTLKYPDHKILSWVNSEALTNFKIDYLRHEYLPSRIKKRIPVFAIAPDTPEMRAYQKRDGTSLRTTKILKQKASFNVEIMIYGKDKIAIMDFVESFALQIQNAHIHHTLKTIFENFWEVLGPSAG
jgi:sugar-specific transcriptional regulator TrmB